MSHLSVERAAGGLVWRDGALGVEVLLVHRPKYDDWTFPKGKVETGESLLECARREVYEEAGIAPKIGRYLGRVSYRNQKDRPKEVDYWAMQAEVVAFAPSAEVDRIRWVDEKSLTEQVSYSTERNLVAGLGSRWRNPADRILLTRHAQAGKRGGWTSDDSTRPLSESGRAQAGAIVEQLRWFEIDTLLTSHAVRCRQTIAPLERARGLVAEVRDELWEEAGTAEVDALIDDLRSGATLLCSHRANITKVLDKLVGDPANLPYQKGSTWVFDFIDRELMTSNYLAAR